MDMDYQDGEEMEQNGQTINDEVMRAVADGAEMTYFSLTRLLAAVRPDELRDELQAGITSDFAALGRPVPTDAQWHMVYVKTDRRPDGTWRISTRPDFLLPGYLVVFACDSSRYARAIQNRCDLVAKQLRQAPLN